MAGWHSLSGYLQYKSGNALGRLITKRKVWCVLEESKCQLHYYKSEEDVHKQRSSQGHIDVNGAAISLDLENQNQFVVLSDGKEHYFTAENHESMMIWLLGLQAKRDIYSWKVTAINENDDDDYDTLSNRRNSDVSMWSRPNLFMALSSSQPLDDCAASQSPRSLNPKSFRWEKYELHKWGESVDSGLGVYKKPLRPTKSLPIKTSRSVPITSRSAPLQHSPPGKTRVRRHHCSISRLSGSPTTSTGSYDSDDVFGEVLKHKKRKGLSRNWRKLQSAVMSQRLQYSVPVFPVRESSYSSRSASSDSAIDKGESSPLELANRLSELESELISTKCELAKVMNQQTCYQELLQQKEQTIKSLERNVGSSHMNGSLKKEMKIGSPKLTKSDKEFQEKIRILQNQNRFLNEEVKKLAKIRLQEHGKYQEQNSKLHSLEADIEKWKMDYVTLIQSSIRFPGEEGTEDLELCLYGGDKHKNRVKSLLEEARKVNPRLPTYDSLANNEVHVDTYGFKHVYTNSGLLLHYLCTELTHHYLVQAGVYEEHQKQWILFMRQHGKSPMKSPKDLKLLCRGGIPDRFRKQVWHHLVHHHVRDLIQEKGEYYYRNLCNMLPESPLASCYRKQVSLDLMRTMPSNVKFAAAGAKGIMDLQDVLLAFCIHNPTIGYCQGMNFIVGMSLIFMDAQDAFWLLVAIAERYFSPHYFDHSLIGAQSDQQVLKDMVKEKLPDLYNHLDCIDIELSTITLNWFLAVFFDAVPFQTLLRIWDCFLLEGPKVLFRFSLAILKLHEKDILQKTDTMGIMKHLKACAKLTYDVEGLAKLAFEGLKPFPKRRDILTKQTCYLNALKEKHKKKELQRLAFAEREQLYMSMEAEAGTFMGIECAVSGPDGKVWLCYGDQHIGRLSCVSCDQGHMTSLNWKLDSRLMCMCSMSPDKLVLGTISWMLLAFNVTKREQEWQIQLHDAILSLSCYEDQNMTTRIFSGLADGTVAVVEQQYKKTDQNMDVLYIPIGQAPVTCLMLQGDQLWCASGNTVFILHAKTLDTMDVLSVSVNPYDHILSLVPGDYGIWITLRGSSILELWDPKLLCCRMLYDTRTDRYPQLKKEDDAYFNRARITSILANGDTVWVGTGEGNLITYEIVETSQLKTPTVRSPSMDNLSNVTCKPKEDELRDLDSKEIKERLLRVDQHSRKRFLEHTDSLEVNVNTNPNSPSPIEFLREDLFSPSQNSSDHEEVGRRISAVSSLFDSQQKPVRVDDASPDTKPSPTENYTEDNIDENGDENDTKENQDEWCTRRQRLGSFTITEEEQKLLLDNYSKTSEQSKFKRWPLLKRKSSDSSLQIPRSASPEVEELESPLEQVYEADARSSFSNQLIEPEEVVHLQTMYNEHVQQTNKKNSKPSLVKLKSESNVLSKKHTEQTDVKTDPKDSAFESKMEEYARRKSSSHVIEVEDFARLQKIYDQTMEAQIRGSRNLSPEKSEVTQNRLKHDGSFESRNSKTSNSPVMLDKDEFERLQTIYDEAADPMCEEEKRSLSTVEMWTKERRKQTSTERLSSANNSSFIVEERDDFERMHTIYDDTVDNETIPRKKSEVREPWTRERRRSSSENDLTTVQKSVNDSPSRQSNPQRKLSHTKPWTRERRRSSSESDILGIQKILTESLECQGRSESLIKCDNKARDEEIYEEKLEQAALRETLEVLSPNCDVTSPSSGESNISNIFTPNSEISDVLEHHLETMTVTEIFANRATPEPPADYRQTVEKVIFPSSRGATLYRQGRCNSNLRINNNTNQNYQSPLPEFCDECLRKGKECYHFSQSLPKAVDYNSFEDTENFTQDKKSENVLKQNGISEKLNERLLQNYSHSEADLKGALNILNTIDSDTKMLGRQELDFERMREQNSSLILDVPNKDRRSLSEGFNNIRGIGMSDERRLSLQKAKVNAVSYDRQYSADSSTEITRQEKVGMWLSSISSDPDKSSSENDSVYLTIKNKRKISGGSSDDEVFFSAREKAPDSNSDYMSDRKNAASKLRMPATKKVGGNYLRTKGTESEAKTENSHASSRESGSSVSEKQVNKKGIEAQYHLEFSGIHIETESEKELTEVKARTSSSDESNFTKMATLGNSDKRKTSLDLGSIQEKCDRFYDSFLGRKESSTVEEYDKPYSKISDRQKLFEYLRTPSLESRQMSLGAKIAEEDLEWTDVYVPHSSNHSPSNSADLRLPDFLKTPSISSQRSSIWSSYENISTTNEQDNRFLSSLHHRGHLSHSVSSGSVSSDNGIIYNVDLTLEAKVKISDKPVKCLLSTSVNNEPIILSCSGSYGDDEAVLKWNKHLNELLWTNEPILEFCPKTKMKILPTYMRRSSNSSYQSHCSEDSATNLSTSSHK